MPENETAELEMPITDVFANIKVEDFKKVDNNAVAPVDEPVNGNTETEPEPKEEVKPEPQAPATVEVPAQPEPEKPVTAVETTVEAEKEIKPEIKQPVAVDWKEEVKKANRDEVLKDLLGLDEFEIGLLKYRRATGDLTPYIEAKSVDYTKMGDEEVMRRNLKSIYKELPDDEFELIYQDEITDRYKLDPDSYDETAMKLGKIKLKVDAERIRQELITKQAQFVIPELPKQEAAPDNDADARAAMEKMVAEWERNVKANEATKELNSSKRLVLGSKGSEFNYEVEDPEEATAAAIDNSKFWSLFNSDEHGTDLKKFYRVREYAKNPEKFEKALIDYGKSLGRKAEIDELKNPSKPEPGSSHTETTGDFFTDIGKAFLTKGKITKN